MLRRFVKYIMIAVTGIIVICYFLGLSAQWISPEKMGMPTYFVMLMPIWIVLMIMIIVFWLCFKKWIHALIVIGIMVVTFGQWRKVVTINNPLKSQLSTVNSQQSTVNSQLKY